LFLPQQGFIPKPPENLGGGNDVQFAVAGDAVQVAFLIIYRSDFTSVKVFFGGGDAKHVGQ
jgi:hypothetical protein